MMGSPEGETHRNNEVEQLHRVTLSTGFWISSFETTQEQYEEVMGRNPSQFKGSRLPVEMVSWDDAQDFLRKLNQRERKARRLPANWSYRLPTEAEWEYCCRAGANTAYCYGNGTAELEDYAWFDSNSQNKTHAVGQKKPNVWGIYDMHGNVLEWCADLFGYYEPDEIDPKGPSLGSNRIIRGGSWLNPAEVSRSAGRYFYGSDTHNDRTGFRVVLTLSQP